MATERRDVELILRAKDLSTKPFQDVQKAVRGLASALDEQLEAAKKGETSFGELRNTMRKLEEAGNALIRQQSLIDLYRKLGDQLEAAQKKAAETREAVDKMREAQAAAGEATKAQTKELGTLERAAERAEKSVARAAEQVEKQAAKLREAGLAVENLEEQQRQLADEAQRTGRALSAAAEGVDAFARQQRELAEARRKAAEASRDQSEADRIIADAVEQQARERAEAERRVAEAMRQQQQAADAARDALARFHAEQAKNLRGFQEAEYGRLFGPVLDEADRKDAEARQKKADLAKAEADAERLIAEAVRDQAKVRADAERAAEDALRRQEQAAEEARAATARFYGEQEQNLRRFREADFARIFAPALAEMERLDSEAREKDALGKAAERDREAWQRLSDELNRAATRYSTLQDSTVRLATANSDLAGTIGGIVDRAAQQRTQLGGLEEQLREIAGSAANITGPVQDYELSLRQLAAAERAIIEQAGLVDRFRNQVAVVRAAREEFAEARRVVHEYAAALADPTRANAEIAERAQQAERALAAASRELNNQVARAREMRVALQAAGIETDKLTEAERRLKAAAESAADSTAKLNEGYEKFGRSTAGKGLFGLSPYALQNLGYQINDVFTQLSSGSSITQTLSQQGAQILQVFPGAFSAMLRYLPAVAAGAAAAAVAIGSIARALDDVAQERRFNALIIASADGANYQAKALVDARRALIEYGASAAEAGEAIREFMDAGLRSDRLVEFGKLAQDVADVTGRKMPDAARALAQGFTGGWNELLKLNDQLNFLTPKQAETIRQMYEAGDAAGAQSAALAILRERYGEAANVARSELTVAVRELRAAWNDLMETLSQTGVIQFAARAMRFLANEVKDTIGLFRGLENVDLGRAIERATYNLAQAEEKLARARERAGDGAGAAPRLAQIQAEVNQARAELERLQARQRTAPQPPPGVEAGSNSRQTISGEEYLRQLDRELGKKNDIAKADRIRVAGEEAVARAKAAQQPYEVQEEARRRAELAERTKIEESERNSLATLQERLNMGRRMTAEQRLQAAEDKARREAERRGEGNADEQAAVARRIEQAKIDEENRAAGQSRIAAERELANQLAQLRSSALKQEKTDLDARLAAIDERYSRLYQSLDRARELGSTSIQGRSFAEVTAEIEAQKQQLKNVETLKYYEDSLNALARQRQDIFRDLLDQQRAGQITASEGFQQAEEATRRITPEMRRLAEEAIRFATGIRGAVPPAQLDAFMARMRRQGNVDADGAGTDAQARADAKARITAQMQEVNTRFAERNAMVATYNELVERGAISQGEADEKIRRAFEGTRDNIASAIAELQKLNQEAYSAGRITETQFNATNAKIQAMGVQLQYINPLLVAVQQGFQQAFSQGLTTAFDSLSQSLAGLIDGTKSWSDVLRDAGNIGLKLIADLLKGIATAILQFYALRIASAAMRFVGLGTDAAGGAAAGAGMTAGAAAVTASSVELASASGFLTVGATELGISAGALMAAAQTLIVANSMRAAGGVAHTGGIAGSFHRTRAVSPSWFAGAPRYHAGTPSVGGLARNEVPAILERGEEVLTRSDPRHILNGGKTAGAGGGGAGQLAIRNVLVMDPNMIPEAMASSQGERVTVASIRKNAGTIRSILGIK